MRSSLISGMAIALTLAQATPAAAGYRYTTLFVGSKPADERLTIIWIPSGYRADEKTAFDAQVQRNVEATWRSNWFADHMQQFEIHRLDGDHGDVAVPVWDADGELKTDTELRSLRAALPPAWRCNFHASFDCRVFPSVIYDTHSTAGGAKNGYIYIDRTALEYEYPHEWGHEVLAWVLEDEYVAVPAACQGSDRARNLDDVPSNRKWAAFISTPPVEGANDCTGGVFRPSRDSIMRSPDSNPDFDALGYEAMSRGLDKRLGLRETRGPTIRCDLRQGDSVAGARRIHCDVKDPSGVEMVEFFTAPLGQRHRSFAIDFEPPFAATLDTTAREQGAYYLRVVAWDNHWNWSQHNPRYTVVGCEALVGHCGARDGCCPPLCDTVDDPDCAPVALQPSPAADGTAPQTDTSPPPSDISQPDRARPAALAAGGCAIAEVPPLAPWQLALLWLVARSRRTCDDTC